jgi:hypothetical protein
VFLVLFAVGRLIARSHLAQHGDLIDPLQYCHSLDLQSKLYWCIGFEVSAWLPQLMTHGTATYVALQRRSTSTAGVGATLRFVCGHVPAFIGFAMIIAIPVLLGTVAFFVPGLIVSAIALMIVPEKVIGGHRFGDALRFGVRSGRKHLGTVITVLVIVMVIWVVAQSVLSALSDWIFESRWSVLLSFSLIGVSGSLVASMLGCVLAEISLDDHGELAARHLSQHA